MKKCINLSVIVAAGLMMGATSVVAEDLSNEEIAQQIQEDQKRADTEIAQQRESIELATKEAQGNGEDSLNTETSTDIQPNSIENANFTSYGSFTGTVGFGAVYIGAAAGRHSTSESKYNTAVGQLSGSSLSTGDYNSLFGYTSGYLITTGSSNTMLGYSAGKETTTGNKNVYIGYFAGSKNKTGTYNTIVGYNSGVKTTVGGQVFIGGTSGYKTTTGKYNTFVGEATGTENTTGQQNTFIGNRAGNKNTTGQHNTYVGRLSGYQTLSARSNTYLGSASGYNTTTGSSNVIIGNYAGYKNKVGSANVFLGNGAGFHELGNNKLYIDNTSSTKPLIYGEFDSKLVRVNGSFETTWSGSNTARDGTKYLVALSANNSEATKTSDAGFSLENKRENFKWEFRTHEPSGGFTATKALSGGAEFVVQNTTTNFHNAKMVVAGVTIFENGHLVTASSRELKTDIKPLDTQVALDAFHKLQPVSYEYKSQRGEAVVGFIAEDVPELLAMPSRKSFDSAEVVAVLTKVVQEQDRRLTEKETEIDVMKADIAELKEMKKKVAMMESILTNLALKTSKTDIEKVSLNK